MRTHVSPSAGSTVLDKVKVYEGGTGEVNLTLSLAVMGAVPLSALNQPGGIATLNSEGSIQQDVFPLSQMATISIVGPSTVNTKSATVYTINNYDCFTDYQISSVEGIVVQDGDKITYIAPSSPSVGGFTINGRVFTVTVLSDTPTRPTLSVTQAAGAGTTVNATLTGTVFSIAGDISTHASTDWQIATDAAFTNIVAQSNANTTDKLSWTGTGLTELTAHYARARYRDSNGAVSNWSNALNFTTIRVTVLAPVITSYNRNGTYFAAGQNATHTVNVSPASQGPLTYTWRAGSTVIRTITTNAQSDSASVNVDTYPDVYLNVTVSNAGGSVNDGGNVYKILMTQPFVVVKNGYGNPGSNQSLGTITHFAQYWIGGDGTQNALFINTLWPNGSGQDPYVKFQYAGNGALVSLTGDGSFSNLITDVKFIIDGVEYTGSVTSSVTAGYLHLEPGGGSAIAQMYKLANNGKTVTVSYRFNGSAPIQRSFTLQVLEAPIPTALEWSSGTNTGTTYGQLSVSSGLNYLLRGNINTTNRALVSAMQIVSGALPPGMSIASIAYYNNYRPSGSPAFNSSSHTITTGNPTTPGTYNFTVRLTWRVGDRLTASNDYPMTVTVVA